MLVGYARVSTIDQKMDRQLDQLIKNGVDERNIYQEKITGTTKERPALIKMINELKENDIVLVSDITRISRSTRDLLDLIEQIKSKKASIKSLKESWLDTTQQGAHNGFLITIMAGLSQLERDLISQRTKEGLESARARGRNGGRPSQRSPKEKLVKTLLKENYKIKDIVTETGLSRTTIYRLMNDIKHEAGDAT